MEVRFRPMQPSTLAREAKSSRSSTEDGASFMEVVESLTAADQTLEQGADTGDGQQPPPQKNPLGVVTEPETDTPEQIADDIPETIPDSPNPQPPDTSDPDEKPLGAHLDLTA